MELTYEEQLLLDNSKEHLKVVLSNVRIATEELSSLLERHRVAKAEIDGFRKEVDEKSVIISEGLKLAEIAIVDRRERERILVERENKLDEELKSKLLIANKQLNDIAVKFTSLKSDHEIYTRRKEEEVKGFENKIKSLEEEVRENEAENSQQLLIKQKIEIEIGELKEELSTAQQALDKFKKESFKESESIQNTITEEKNRVRNPVNLLRREKQQLEKFKLDLGVIKARLIRQFKDQNPERILPIELQ